VKAITPETALPFHGLPGGSWGNPLIDRQRPAQLILAAMPPRRFPRPWRFEPIPGGYRVIDANGLALAHVYGQPPDAIALSDKRLTNDVLSGGSTIRQGTAYRQPASTCGAKSPQFSSVPPNHPLLGSLRTRANHPEPLPTLLGLPSGSHGLRSKQCATGSASADVVTPAGKGRPIQDQAPSPLNGFALAPEGKTGALPTASGDRPWIDLGLLQHVGWLPPHLMMPTRRACQVAAQLSSVPPGQAAQGARDGERWAADMIA
jgi:hypothetical protein